MIECPPVGVMNKIVILEDYKGPKPDWFVNQILIEDVNEHVVYGFQYYEWLGTNKNTEQMVYLPIPSKPIAPVIKPIPPVIKPIPSKEILLLRFNVTKEKHTYVFVV